MNKKIIEEFKSILIPAEFYTDKVYTELSLSKEESMTILKYINNLEEQNNKYKEVLDKIKEDLIKTKKYNKVNDNNYINIDLDHLDYLLEILEEIE